jgi:hypothetical protein
VPPTSVPHRVARGCAVALVGVTIAAAGHGLVAGSSPLPPVSPLTVLVTALVAAGLVAASARAWTLPRLLVGLGLVQVAVHGALWLDSGGGEVDPRLSALVVEHHAHAHTGAVWSGPMLAAHAVAVVVAAALLARVDATVDVLVELARRLVVRWRPVAVDRPARLVSTGRPSVASASLAGFPAILRRGPPAVAASG